MSDPSAVGNEESVKHEASPDPDIVLEEKSVEKAELNKSNHLVTEVTESTSGVSDPFAVLATKSPSNTKPHQILSLCLKKNLSKRLS